MVTYPPCNAGDMGSIPSQGNEISCTSLQLSLLMATAEAHELWSLQATTREPTCCNHWAYESQPESPCTAVKDPIGCNQEFPCHKELRRSHMQANKSINKYWKKTAQRALFFFPSICSIQFSGLCPVSSLQGSPSWLRPIVHVVFLHSFCPL